MTALMSKPGQTLAPLLGTWFLFLETGTSVFFDGSKPVISVAKDSHINERWRTGCFNVLVYVPVVCGLVQLFAWSQFKLKGKRLNEIKYLRTQIERKSDDTIKDHTVY